MDNIIVAAFLIFLLLLIALDIAMIVSLVRPGDERKRLIVYKASTYTLLGAVGSMMLDVVESLVKMEALAVNPFTKLSAIATIYFALLLYFKRKYGG